MGNVKIVDPKVCKKELGTGDNFVQSEKNHEKIICAEGYRNSNTCGGDSGGGLLCFDETGEKYYFLGPLHGGSADCEAGPYVYFTDIGYSKYDEWIRKEVTK